MAGVSTDLELVLDSALAQVDALEARLAEVATLQLDVAVDTATAEAELSALAPDAIEVPVDADTAPAEAEIDSVEAPPIEVEVSANTEAASDALSEVASSAGGATGALDALDAAQVGVGQSGAGLITTLGRTPTAATAAAIGVGAAATAGYQFVQAYGEAQAVAAATNTLIENTGGRANVTAEQVAALGQEIMGYGVASDEAVGSAANQLLAMENVRNEAGRGNDIFTRAIRLGADYAAVTGQDMTSATFRFGRALNDPVRGMSLLRRTGIQFTESQQAQITALAESGDLLGAQRILLEALEGRYKGAAETFGTLVPGQLGRARESFGEAAEALGEELAPAAEAVATGLADIAPAAAAGLEPVVTLVGALGELTSAGAQAAEDGGFAGFISDINDAIGSQLNPIERASDAWERYQGTTEGASFAVGPVIDKGTEAMEDQADAASGLSAEVAQLSTDLDALYGSEQSVAEGGINLRNAQRQLLGALAELPGGYRAGTASGDEFLGTAIDLARTIRTQTLNLLDLEGNTRRVGRAQDVAVGGLRRVLVQAGLTDGQIRGIIRTFALVPDVAGSAVNGAGRQMDRLPERARRTTTATAGEFRRGRADAERAGRDLGEGGSRGVGRGLEGAPRAARQGAEAAGRAVRAGVSVALSGGIAVGESFTSGIVSGIATGSPAVAEAARGAVRSAEQAARAEAQAASPSRLFARLGRDMADGIGAGMAEGSSGVVAEAERVVARAARVRPVAVGALAGVGVGGGGGSPVTFTQYVDARGATDPTAVATAAADGADSVLRGHQLRVDVALRQST